MEGSNFKNAPCESCREIDDLAEEVKSNGMQVIITRR